MEHNYKVKDATSFSIDLIVELVNNQYLSYFNINKDKTKDRKFNKQVQNYEMFL